MNINKLNELFGIHFIDFQRIFGKLHIRANSLEHEFKTLKIELQQANQKLDELSRFQNEVFSKTIQMIISSNNVCDVHNLNSIMLNSKSLTPPTMYAIEKAIAYLKLYFAEDISREGLAESVGVSPDHFSRMFKKYTGKRIKDFINELRIENVIKLFSDEKKKIIDIALECGFENVRSFNVAFKKIKGMTPTDYKKNNHCLS